MVLESCRESLDSFDSFDNIEKIYSSMPPTGSKLRDSVHELQHVQDFDTTEADIGKPTWRSLFNFTTRRHIPHLLVTFIFTILSSLLQPAGAIIYGKVFTVLTLFGSGRLSPSDTVHRISILCIALVILGTISWVVEFCFLSLWMSFGELQARSVRQQMFSSMLRKNMNWYDMREDGIGSLLVRIETQTRELQLSASQPFGFCMYEISVSIVALCMGFYFSWELTLVILATLPILVIVLFFVSRHLGLAIEAQKRELNLASKHASTAIVNVSTVKAYNGQEHEIWQYYTTVKRVAASYSLQARANALQLGIIKCATVGLFIQGFWFGLVLVDQGMDPGRVYTTYYACLIAMQSIEVVLPQWLVLAKGKSAGHALKSIMKEFQRDRGRNPDSFEGSVVPPTCSGDIEIKNVSFSYPSNHKQNAMTGVNFFFPANETTYIVGHSGSGKSTVGNLLLRYYDINQGDILIDGHPIQTLDINWLRGNITLVQQQSVLFNETVLQNIAFGRKASTSTEEILEAAQMADLQQTLDDLPEGLNTVVGSTGKSLSGGQQQRIALARARLRDSAIVILDEAASALDQKSRTKVMERIRQWRKGKTTIIITHDVSRILDEEYVYVLEHGVIVQEGYRKTLAEKTHGTFASFLPAGEAMSSLSPQQISKPISPVTPGPESALPNFDEVNSERGALSRILGQNSGSRPGSGRQDIPLAFRRPLSIVTSSIRDSAIQALEYWTTPELPGTVKFSSLDQSRRRSAISSPLFSKAFDRRIATGPFIPLTRDPLNHFQHEDPEFGQLYSSYCSPRPRIKESEIKRSLHRPPLRSERENFASFKPLPLSCLDTSIFSSPETSKRFSVCVAKDIQEFSEFSCEPAASSVDSTLVSEALGEFASKSSGIQGNSAQQVTHIAKSENSKKRKAASLTHILRTIWPTLNRRGRGILIFGFFASFVVSVSTPAFAYVLAQLLNVYYLPTNRSATAQKWALILIAIAIVDGFATFWSHLALECAAQQWVNGLRVEALKRILAQPRSRLDKEENSPGRLSECLDRDAEEMRNLVGRFMGPVFITTWMMGITIVWSFIISYKLTLVAMSCFPIVYVSTRIYDWITTRLEEKCNQAAGTASSIFTETISNIRVVRALTLEEHFKQKHENAVNRAWKLGLKRSAYSGIMFGVIDSLSFFIVAIIFRFGSVAATSEQLSLLNMLQVINLLLFGISNAVSLLNMMPQINSSRTTGTQMLYLAQLPKNSSHESNGTKRIPSPFPVVFKDLSFTYPNRADDKTLDSINLTIESGTCTAIVGPSGSGKSTIASLMLGLYPPDTFSPKAPAPLSFAGVPIHELNLPSLRNFISIVAQQPLLFPTTIYTNITYGLPESSPYLNLSSAIRAAQDAGIHDFISSLSSGYKTLIGEGGIGISGGQAQRIAIARALVRRPKILILDEATSALDKVSADAIKDRILRIMHRTRLQDPEMERTAVVLISHDVEMMKVAERIVVVQSGRVVEEGTFDDLSRKGKAFMDLIERDIREDGV